MLLSDREVLARSQARRDEAMGILAELGLMQAWAEYGRPVLVGAVAHDLVWGRDIDMEVYCPRLRISDGFAVLSQASQASQRVVSAQFGNFLAEADQALYWQLKYRLGGGEEWKVDMWSAAEDYGLPRGESLLEPLRAALTPETRLAILRLKQAREAGGGPDCLSIDLYRAVVRDGVRQPEELRNWLASNEVGGLSAWRPGGVADN
ncbi:MAG: hypothetical protein V1797_07510 [Pseudomonadota bacterium]